MDCLDNKKPDSLFSYRMNLERKDVQIGTMSTELRNRIWTKLHTHCFQPIQDNDNPLEWHRKLTNIYDEFFKLPVDETHHDNYIHVIRDKFFEMQWFEVFNFIEFLLQQKSNEKLPKVLNQVLEAEFSGYRIINNIVTQITNPIEIDEITRAQQTDIPGINTHLKRSLQLLSDKQNPDPRNSIKESISAVETICKTITGNDNATLGQTLAEVEKKVHLNSEMKEALQKLYKYTNDANGIRHAFMDKKSPSDFADAKFMLVVCSAFVNYLIMKTQMLS